MAGSPEENPVIGQRVFDSRPNPMAKRSFQTLASVEFSPHCQLESQENLGKRGAAKRNGLDRGCRILR